MDLDECDKAIAIEGCLYFWISVGKFLFCLGVKVLFEGYTAKTSSDSRKNETNIFEAKHKILSFGQFLLVSADIDIQNFKAVKLMSDKELDNNITITHSPLLSCVGGN